jgi:hypothetical protein
LAGLVPRPEASPQPALKQPGRAIVLRSRLSGALPTMLAMAASFLIALGVGIQWQHMRHQGGASGTPGMLASNQAAQGYRPSLVPSSLVSTSLVPTSLVPSVTATAAAGLRAVPAPATGPGGWQMVTVSMPKGPQGGQEAIELPAVERDSIDEAWLRNLPAAMPADVLQALERTGHRVQQHRDLVPVEMNDGRRLVVPVDRVEIHYVGDNATY